MLNEGKPPVEAGAEADEKVLLVHRWLCVNEDSWEERRQWYTDAAAYLERREQSHGEHWFCHNAEVAAPLLELMGHYRQQPSVQLLWEGIARQVSGCGNGSQCVVEYHAARDRGLGDDAEEVLRSLDVARIVEALREAVGLQPFESPPQRVLNGLFEAICYLPQLDDGELVGLFAEALLKLKDSHGLDITAGGCYQGLYFLLAHENPKLRSLVQSAVRELGTLQTVEDAEDALWSSLLSWVQLIEFDQFGQDPPEGSKPRYVPQRLHVWGALDLTLQLLNPSVFAATLERVPSLVPIILTNACVPPARGDASGNLHWRSLSCLGHLLERMGPRVWEITSYDPSVVVDDLIGQAFRAREERFHKSIIGKLSMVLKTLEEREDGEGLDAMRRRVLYFLLMQVPNSANFQPLARSLAKRSAFDILWQAMASGVPTASAAHIYGPSLVESLTQSREIIHMEAHSKAVKLVEATLQADSAALVAVNSSWETPADLSNGSEAEDVDSIASVAGDNAIRWQCCPALWQCVSRHKNVRVGLALMRSASHLSLTCPKTEGQRSEAGGWCRDAFSILDPLERARNWAIAAGWMDSSHPNGVVAGSLGRELLEELRVAAKAQVDCMRDSGHLKLRRGLGDAARGCLRAACGCHEVYAAMMEQPVGATAVRAAVRTIMQRWNRGIEPDVAIQMIRGGYADELASFLGAVHPLLAKGVAYDDRQLAHDLFYFWLETLQACLRLLPQNPGDSPPPLSQPFLLEAFKAASKLPELFSAAAMRWNPWVALFLDWVPFIVNSQSPRVRKSWEDAFLKVVEVGVQSGAVDIETIARLQSSLRGCAGLPDETRVRLAPLVPLGTKVGSLGMRSLEELPARLLQSSKVSQPSLPSPREAREERGEKEEVIDLTSPPGSPRASEAGSPIIIDDEQPPRTAEMARPPDKALLAGQQRPPQPLQEPSPPVPEALRRLLTSRKLPGTRGPQGKEQKGAERAGPRRDEQLWPSSWPSGVPVVKEASQVGRAPWSKAPLAGRGGAALGRPLTISVPSRPWSTENPPRAPRPLPDEKTPPAALVESSDDDLFNSAAPGQVFPSGCRGKPSAPQRRTTVAISAMGINSAPYAQRRARGGSSGPVMTVKEVQAEVLQWDYFRQVAFVSAKDIKLPKATNNFTEGLESYSRYFRKLLVEELRASLQSDFEEMTRLPGPLPGLTLQQYGGFQAQAEDRMEVRFQVDQEQLRVLREGGGNNPRADDLLLLTRRPWKDTSALKSNQPVTHALATVTRLEAINGAMVLTLLLNLRVGAETPGATPCRPSQVLRHLLPRSTWSGLRVTSLVPQMRELAALSAVHTLDGNLQGVILDPRTAAGALPPPPPLSAVPLPRRLKEKLQEDYNPSQLLAIAAAVCGPARVTLVQGPPGTGKTAAIVGIISALSACARGEEGGAAGRGRSGGGSGAAGLREGGGEKEAQGDRGEREVTWEEQVAAMEGGEAPAARVLVCAQSNAAIDELLLRLASRGLYGRDGRRRAAAVVRAGVATPGGKSALFHIDEWAARRQRRAAENDDKDAAAAGLEAIRAELDKVKAMIQEVNEKDVGENKGGSTTRQQLDKLHDQRRQLMVKFDGARHRAFKERGRAEMVRREERAAVLRDAEVVLCTLSSAGGDLLALARMVNSSDSRGGVRGPDSGGGGAALFDAIIIDEAAQAVEPAALIPLQLLRDGRKIILVGDTNQLPPTVKSQAPGAVSLSQSLFARMQSARYPMLMLDEQYRMHPAISAFPCRHFYDGKLRDGVKAVAAPFHQAKCFGPYVFFDCQNSLARFSGASITNQEEAELVAALLAALDRHFAGEYGTVAVLTPYRAQKMALERKLRSVLGDGAAAAIAVQTVDGYQGQEADIVVFSCVRADREEAGGDGNLRGVGFLADVRRLNVAITRAKRGLWIVGHADTLKRNETWAALVADAESRGVLLATPRPYRPFLDRHCSTGAADGPQGTLEPRGALRKQQAPRAREQSLPGSTDAFERDKGENTHRRETIRGTESKKAETERKVTRDSGEAAAPRDSGALQGPKARRQASRVDERGTPEQGTSNALKAVRSSSGLPSEGGVERATDAIDWHNTGLEACTSIREQPQEGRVPLMHLKGPSQVAERGGKQHKRRQPVDDTPQPSAGTGGGERGDEAGKRTTANGHHDRAAPVKRRRVVMPVGRSLGDDGRPAAATLRPGGVAVAADVAGGRQGTSRGFSQEPPARAGLSAGAPSLPGCSLRASGAPGSLGRLLPAGASPMDARGLFRSVSPPASVPAHPSTGQHFRRRPAARAVSGPSAPSDQSDWALAAKALGRVGVQGAQRGGGETNGGGRGAGGSCPSRQLVKGGGGSKTSRFFKDR